MARQFTPKVVTANALLEGDVVYLTADDRWTRAHTEAELIEERKKNWKGLEQGDTIPGLDTDDVELPQEALEWATLVLDFSSDTEKTTISASDISRKIDGSRLDHFRAVIFKTKNWLCFVKIFKTNVLVN